MSRLPAIENPHRKPYPSDLSDAEWLILKPLLPTSKGFEHPLELSKLEVVWVDQGYSGKNFAQAVKQVCRQQVRVEVIERISKTFERLLK
ncbi:transposase [Nostoc mirabile]|uniref:transposase n=1 Tax=Nostoc mirabile TaxID=2907820 RepID=UPI003555D889